MFPPLGSWSIQREAFFEQLKALDKPTARNGRMSFALVRKCLRLAVLLCALSGLSVSRAIGQGSGVLAGIASYHLNSSGVGLVAAPYLRKDLGGSLSLVGSVPMLIDTKTEQLGFVQYTEVRRLLLPEVRIEAARELGSLTLFLGAGGGIGI